MKKLLVVLSLVVMLLVAVTPASAGGRAVEVEELQCGFIAVSLAEKISSYSLIVTLRSADGTSSRAQLVAMFGGSRYWYATHPDSWTPEPGVWKVVRVRSTNGEFDQWIGHRDIAVTCGGGDGSTSEGNLL